MLKDLEFVNELKNSGCFFPIDIHFAGLIARLNENPKREVILAAALASNSTQKRHVCLDLKSVAGKPLSVNGETTGIKCPPLPDWIDILKASRIVGTPGEFKPLILDKSHRLYLYRYWHYENYLAARLRELAGSESPPLDYGILRDGLNRLFPSDKSGIIDYQKIAAFIAVTRRLCVISGGPGTGKTATIARILALLLEQNQALRIALCAPTGKACAGLKESIRENKDSLNIADSIKSLIPDTAFTIHRLLKTIPHSPYFRHDDRNPLPFDVLIVDETSMVDLALLAKLVSALLSKASLILLGDRNQLASVEAGAVMGDIFGSQESHSYSKSFCELHESVTGETIEYRRSAGAPAPLADCIVELSHSYRFGRESGIGVLSRKIIDNDINGACLILRENKFNDVRWFFPSPQKNLSTIIKDYAGEWSEEYFADGDPLSILGRLNRRQVFCALREGPYGVKAINNLIDNILKSLMPDALVHSRKPIIITENDYDLGLFNGDIGIILPDRDSDNKSRAFFIDSEGDLRKYPLSRLPAYEAAYAITVHKSQGSEFDEIMLILPDRDSPVLTRELFYTALTRARQKAVIHGDENIIRACLARTSERMSALAEYLWT
jgi:exodeoxyribonuclease V alpha subunit